MIENSQHDSEAALAQLLDDLVPVAEMLVVADAVLLLVRVETVVDLGVLRYLTINSTARQVRIASVLYPLVHIEEVDDVVLENLLLLVLPQVGGEDAHGVLLRHGELYRVRSLTVSMSLLRCKLRGSLR